MSFLTTVTPAGPPADLSWTIAALAIGLVLWATGGWVLRSATGAMGLAVGGLLGWMAWQETGIGPPWVAPLIGAITVACVAILAYRLLAGALLAVVLALLCGAVAWTVLHLTDPAVGYPPVGALFGLPVLEDASLLAHLASTPLVASGNEWIAGDQLAPFRLAWEALPADPRLIVLVAAAAGGLAGLLLSTLAASNAAVILTSAAGALLVLVALPRLLLDLGYAPSWLGSADTASGAILVWLGATAVGMVVQGLAKPRLVKPQSSSGST